MTDALARREDLTPAVRPRVVIAGGGTGGHLFPGLALGHALRERGCEVFFVGAQRGIEARVLPQQGLPHELLQVRALKGGGLGGLLRGLRALPEAALQSWSILRRFRATAVVGVGGYASGPLVLVGALTGRTAVILEQNSVPGLTNRALARVVRRIYTTFERTKHLPADKQRCLGNPVRPEIIARLAAAPGDRLDAHDAHRPLRVLVLGGSQGARAVNRAVVEALTEVATALAPQGGVQWWHQTGRDDEARTREGYAAAGVTDARVDGFIEDMAEPYLWCDVVLCRAGATSIAELEIVGKPAVFIPLPSAADDHQTHNAVALVDAGAAFMVAQREASPRRLAEVLARVAQPEARAAMAEKMALRGRPHAGAAIADDLLALCGRSGV